MNASFADAWSRLPDYLGQHILVSAVALALGVGIALPVAILATRYPRLRAAALALAGTVQTIPGLALLALFYPLLLGLAALTERWLGFGFSALGFLPSVLALALYSMLPILRNTIAGIQGIDPALRRAAIATGMTDWQSLRLVELPLAMPVIMAGIRTSAVWVIGTATLSTPVGQTSLGNYIFTGLQTQNWVLVLFGCAAAALLALLVDALLGLIERDAADRARWRFVVGGTGLAMILLLALPWNRAQAPGGYVIGAKPFTEQLVLASLIDQRLTAAGLTAQRREGLGSSVVFEALRSNEIDVYVEYTGTIYSTFMKQGAGVSREKVRRAVATWLQDTHQIVVVGGLGFENAYALAMSQEKAKSLNIRSLDELGRHASTMTIAADYEFFGRPEWSALKSAYGLRFTREQQMQPEFLYRAAGREADVIAAYSSDGRIAQYGLTVLADPKGAIPPYDAVLLVSPRRAQDAALLAALRPLVDAIDVETMREANRRANDGSPVIEAARWLSDRIAARPK